MNRFQNVLLAAAVLAGSFTVAARAQDASRTVAVTNVRIFDGTRVIPRGTVVFQGGKILAVGEKAATPAGAQVVDGAGQTILPGFIDSHTHTWGEALERALVFGVTTELDMFTDPGLARQMRDEQAKSGAPGRADLYSAGILATAPGGHGTEYGMTVPTLTKPEEAQAWVDARVAEGSDYVKIVIEDGSPYGRKIPTLDQATVAALVTAAHKRGKLAVVHVSTEDGAREAIEAGADGLVHIFSDRAPEPGFAALIARHKAFVTPTLTVVESTAGVPSGKALIGDARLTPYLRTDEVQNLGKSFPTKLDFKHALAAVGQLAKAGVPILAGTDSPNPGTTHGASIHRELELLVSAGLSPTAALTAATATPARIFGLKDRGRIAPGLRADLVLVKGDPTTDILATRDIQRVWKLGHEAPRPKADKAAAPVAKPAPAPASGEISDFEDGTTAVRFGSPWTDSTDQLAGGKSIVRKEIVDGGANGSRKSLAISGEVRQGFAFPWAGLMFLPGPQPMAPSDLSAFGGVSFEAKGEAGATYQFMAFATHLGRMPVQRTFTAGPEWKRVTFSFTDLGLDGTDIMGLFVGGGPALGPFRLQIDDARLTPKGEKP
ncbi:MAG TPA: amidohydrolase family protein [Thermoanaerobaculia bacterium]|jgi:imidazolonepropionase-like amidohydrolase|nr:amidohydrolase family protein [Thermoanaerobaculia bacterium]